MASNIPTKKLFLLILGCFDLLVIHTTDLGSMDVAAPHKRYSAFPQMMGRWGHNHSTATVALQPPLDSKDRVLFACTHQHR